MDEFLQILLPMFHLLENLAIPHFQDIQLSLMPLPKEESHFPADPAHIPIFQVSLLS